MGVPLTCAVYLSRTQRENIIMAKLFIACLFCFAATLSHAIETVPELDVENYIGRWYTVYANRLAGFTFGSPDPVCITATYGVYNASAITVYNNGRDATGDGPVNFICGHAYRTTEPGKLLVQFVGRDYFGNYWVSKLGPKGEDNLYEFSVVSGASTQSSLFVLARDPVAFAEKYEAEVLEFLEELGFNSFLTEPLPVYQGDDCQYPPMVIEDCDEE